MITAVIVVVGCVVYGVTEGLAIHLTRKLREHGIDVEA